MSKFILGPLQTAWIATMRQYPERQSFGQLGTIRNDNIQVCCLGQGLMVLNESLNIENTILNGGLVDGPATSGFSGYLVLSYPKLGLRCSKGSFNETTSIDDRMFRSLSVMNDGGYKWAQIADYMEAHPENVFVESK